MILVTVIALTAFSLGLSFGLGNLSIPSVDDLIWQANSLNPFHKYEINSNCELFYFLQNGPSISTLSQPHQEFVKKYSAEVEKMRKAMQTPEYMGYLSTFPRDNTKMPLEMKEAMSSIMIKAYSINPKLKQSVIDVLGYGPSVLYTKIMQEEPDCEEKIKAKQSEMEKSQGSIIARISAVIEGSGAEKAGLLKGDIITAINGTRVSFPSDFAKIHLKAGQTVIVSIIRDGKTIQIPVVPDPSKEDPQKGLLGILRENVSNKTQH